MIRSMTGFGRAAFEVDGVEFEVEIRSVNHRHLDVRVRLPRQLADQESPVRARVQARLQRGKVDVNVATPSGALLSEVEIDVDAARRYIAAARQLTREQGVGGGLDVARLLSLPGVARVVDRGLSAEALVDALGKAVDAALGALDGMRRAEGEALEQELDRRLSRIAELTEALGSRAHLVKDGVREKLRKRAEQLRQEAGGLDDSRLHQEIVIAADRLDVREEIVRLRSHVSQFREIVAGAGPADPVGRRLEFLLQELLREANTIGSKANDASLAHDVVELKTELERVREQVQNVE